MGWVEIRGKGREREGGRPSDRWWREGERRRALGKEGRGKKGIG